jgi:hypothetical protein
MIMVILITGDAFKNPDMLDRFNYCRYVHQHLLQAALKVREEVILLFDLSLLMTR